MRVLDLFSGAGGLSCGFRQAGFKIAGAVENNIKVLEEFNFEAPKTKEFINLKNNLDVTDKKVLLVLSEQNKNIYLSSRNLQGVKVVTISELATYDIMNASVVLLAENSIEPLHKMFKI